jgi:predicted P-loop ATPase
MRVLCGQEWFCDDVEDFGDKDTKLKLRGKWIIELGELSPFSRAR